MSNVTVKSSTQKIIVHSPDSISVVSAGPIGPGGPGVDVPVTSVDGRIGDVTLDDLYDASGSAADVETAASNALSTEATTRSNADTSLDNALSTEATTRGTADSALDTRIDALEASPIGGDLTAEIAARIDGDEDLASDIADESTARASGDSTNAAAISSEATARAAAITTEATARSSADTTLATSISTEATSRAAADSAISSDLVTEATTRAAADASIASDLSTETTDRTTADNAADARLDLLETAPPAHHTSHESGGSDELSLAQSQVVGLIAALAAKATPSDITTAINNLVGGSPGLLDTLKEIADALGDDPNFAATMTAALAGKQAASAELTILAAQTSTATGRSIMVAANAAAIQIILGLVPGTDVQAHSTVLDNTTAAFTATLKTKLDLLQNLAADPFWAGKNRGTIAAWDGTAVVPNYQPIGAPTGDLTMGMFWYESIGAPVWFSLTSAGIMLSSNLHTGMAGEYAAKGDILVGTASGAFSNLNVGANGTVPTADSSAANGITYKSPKSDYTNNFLLGV